MKKYKAYLGYDPKITIVEIERETESSVWLNGRRNNKRSSYENYFDTWQEAHSLLREHTGKKLVAARRRLKSAQDEYGNILEMMPSDCA